MLIDEPETPQPEATEATTPPTAAESRVMYTRADLDRAVGSEWARVRREWARRTPAPTQSTARSAAEIARDQHRERLEAEQIHLDAHFAAMREVLAKDQSTHRRRRRR